MVSGEYRDNAHSSLWLHLRCSAVLRNGHLPSTVREHVTMRIKILLHSLITKPENNTQYTISKKDYAPNNICRFKEW